MGCWLFYDSLNCLIEEHFYLPLVEADEGTDEAYHTIKVFYPNGKVKEEKTYAFSEYNDYPKGIWKYYNEKGKLIKTEEYENGELIKTKKHKMINN